MRGYRLDQAGSGQGQVAGNCECGNEASGSIKCRESLDQLKTSQLLKKDSALWSEYHFIFSYYHFWSPPLCKTFLKMEFGNLCNKKLQKAPIRFSICLAVWLTCCLSIWLAVCLSGYLSGWLSIFLSVCLSVCLSMCLSVYVSHIRIRKTLNIFPLNVILEIFAIIS